MNVSKIPIKGVFRGTLGAMDPAKNYSASQFSLIVVLEVPSLLVFDTDHKQLNKRLSLIQNLSASKIKIVETSK